MVATVLLLDEDFPIASQNLLEIDENLAYLRVSEILKKSLYPDAVVLFSLDDLLNFFDISDVECAHFPIEFLPHKFNELRIDIEDIDLDFLVHCEQVFGVASSATGDLKNGLGFLEVAMRLFRIRDISGTHVNSVIWVRVQDNDDIV